MNDVLTGFSPEIFSSRVFPYTLYVNANIGPIDLWVRHFIICYNEVKEFNCKIKSTCC
jgi:hypothetical protein